MKTTGVAFRALILLAVVLAVVALAVGCSKKQNAGDITAAMANKVTDSMGFDNGQKVTGDKPAGSADSGVPQIKTVSGIPVLSNGAFFLNLESDGAAALPGVVEGAIVHVPNSQYYIKVTQKIPEGGAILAMTGLFTWLSDFANLQPINIDVALFKTVDGNLVPGVYKTWAVSFKATNDNPLDKSNLEQAALEVTGGKTLSGELPAPSGESGARPTVQGISTDPASPPVGMIFRLLINYKGPTEVQVAKVMMQVAGASFYTEYDLPEPSTGGTISVSSTTASPSQIITLGHTPATGYTFVSYLVVSSSGGTIAGNQLTVTNNVTVTGSFTATSYSVALAQPTGGTIGADSLTASYNQVVTLTNTAANGYSFSYYSVVTGTGTISGNQLKTASVSSRQ